MQGMGPHSLYHVLIYTYIFQEYERTELSISLKLIPPSQNYFMVSEPLSSPQNVPNPNLD